MSKMKISNPLLCEIEAKVQQRRVLLLLLRAHPQLVRQQQTLDLVHRLLRLMLVSF